MRVESREYAPRLDYLQFSFQDTIAFDPVILYNGFVCMQENNSTSGPQGYVDIGDVLRRVSSRVYEGKHTYFANILVEKEEIKHNIIF